MKTRNLMLAAVFSFAALPFAAAAEPKEEKKVLIDALIFKVRGEAYREMKLDETFGKTDTQQFDSEQLSTMIKKAKALGGLDVLSHPQLMIINGQQGVFNVGQMFPLSDVEVASDSNGGQVLRPKLEYVKIGLEFKCTPKVADDGRSTQVQIQFWENSVDPLSRIKQVKLMATPVREGGSPGVPVPVMQYIQQPVLNTTNCKTTACVQDGKSVLVKVGSRECENRVETKVPMLGDLPYLSRLFRNVGVAKDTEYTFLVLTFQVCRKPTEMAVVQPVPPTVCATPVLMPPPLPMAAWPMKAQFPMPVHPASRFADQMPVPTQQYPADDYASRVVSNVASVPQNAPVAVAGKHAAILKILIEQYQAACKTGDTAKARTIAAHCLELDPTCFAK